MGWKLLKERFRIEHVVCMRGGMLTIGSHYIPNLVSIDPTTGKLSRNETFARFADEHYPELVAAAPEELIRLLAEPDQFSESLPVWTYDGAAIIEQQCEQRGYPNITHDGSLQYDNCHFATKEEAIAKAKRVAVSSITMLEEIIAEHERKIADARARLAMERDNLVKLAAMECRG